jgi:hypothetical protein
LLGGLPVTQRRKWAKRDEWLADVDARQRNIVFPDTVANEARFWRNIMSGHGRLSGVQIVGIALFVFAFIATFAAGVIQDLRYSTERTARQILAYHFEQWFLGFLFLAVLLGAIKLATRKSALKKR